LEELDSFPTVKSRPHLITEPAGEDRPTEIVVSQGSFLGGPRKVIVLYWPRMIPGWVMFMDAEELFPCRPDPRDCFLFAPVLDCDGSFTRSISFPKVSLTKMVLESVVFLRPEEIETSSWAKRHPVRGMFDYDSPSQWLFSIRLEEALAEGRDTRGGRRLTTRIHTNRIFAHPWLNSDPLPPQAKHVSVPLGRFPECE
jgi:hypothetical protein